MHTLAAIWMTWRREWMARGALLLLGPIALLLGLVMPESVKPGWYPFVAVIVMPLVAVGLGVAGDPRADRWWAGLGGRPAVRAWARVGLHLAVLVCPMAGALPHAINKKEAVYYDVHQLMIVTMLIMAILYAPAVIYLSVATVRLFAGGFTALVGPVWVALLVGVAGWADWSIGSWSVLEGVTMHALLLMGLALGALVWGEARLLRPRHALAVFLGSAGLVGLTVAVQAAWTGRPLTTSLGLYDIRAGGAEALYVQDGRRDELGARRALLWRSGVWSAVGPAGARWASFGPKGSLAVLAADSSDSDDSAEVALALVNADGQEQRCVFDHMPWLSGGVIQGFSADGHAVSASWHIGGKGGTRTAVAMSDGTCVLEETDAAADEEVRTKLGLPAAAPIWSTASESEVFLRWEDVKDGRIVEKSTGRSWPLPAPFRRSSPPLRTNTWNVRLPDGTLRLFGGDFIYDVSPNGEFHRQATTLLCALLSSACGS